MNQQIINLRALAILMVVLGHSIIIYDNSFNLLTADVQMPLFETVKHGIAFVQMKLFISISGFLLAYKCLRDNRIGEGDFVKGKALRLMVPYVCILLLYNDPIKWILKVPGYESPSRFLTDQLLGMNCAHLWYLPCLFILMAVCYPLFCWAEKSLWKHIIIFGTFLVINYFSGRIPKYYQLNEAGYYLVFFHLGYLLNFVGQEYHNRLEFAKNRIIQLLIFVGSVIVGYGIYKVTSIGFEIYLSIGVLLLLYVFMPCFNNRVINEISKRSYGLYLFHSPLIYITATFCPDINPWLMLFVNFVCFGSVAYLITITISKSRLRFIIGE
jgi:peptidoglycan/LPS O-acetylase OafA/YrhL